MRLLGLTVLTATLVLASGGRAEARGVTYYSSHPFLERGSRGFCHIDVPHVHAAAPADTRFYRHGPEGYYFVGDPAPFEYEGPRHAYYSAHPVADAGWGEPVYCYLEGPHYHSYQPAASAQFELRGGSYWFVGTFGPSFERDRTRYVVINDAYRPMPYARPVVDVSAAPPGFHGVIVADLGRPRRGRGPAVAAGVAVSSPSLQIHVGIGGAPPPPPRYVVVEHHHVHDRFCGHVYEGRHDHGKHKGWYKDKGHGKHGGRR